MDVEEIHTILKGATRVQTHLEHGKYKESDGADFNLTMKWFKKCGIIDGKLMTEKDFVHHYERLAPNREDLTLTQMVALFGILSREAKKDINFISAKFCYVREEVTDEIREYWRKLEKKNKEEGR